MSLNSNTYIIGFAGAVCVVCSLFVSGAAVSLRAKQNLNAKLDLQKNITRKTSKNIQKEASLYRFYVELI